MNPLEGQRFMEQFIRCVESGSEIQRMTLDGSPVVLLHDVDQESGQLLGHTLLIFRENEHLAQYVLAIEQVRKTVSDAEDKPGVQCIAQTKIYGPQGEVHLNAKSDLDTDLPRALRLWRSSSRPSYLRYYQN